MSKHTVTSLVKHAGIAERSCVYVAGILPARCVGCPVAKASSWCASGVAVLIRCMSRFACFPHHR
jgi:hypothetical protein